MTTSTQDWNSIRSWLTKQASLPEKEDTGTPATTGAHDAQNVADAKKAVPGVTVEESKKNPATGKMNNPVPGSGLLQTTTGHMPEVENAVKTVTEESEKAANADLSTDEGFATALDALRKAAAELPLVFAQAGMKIDQTPTTKKAAPVQPTTVVDPAVVAKQAQDAQAAAVIDGYRKLGADRGSLTAEYIKAYHNTYDALCKMAADGSMDAMLANDPTQGGGAPPPAAPVDAGPPPGAGGPPPGAPPGGDAGGQPSLDDVAAALAEMGMTPDDLMQIAQKMKGEAEAAPAPDAGGPPAEAKEAAVASMVHVIKTANDAKVMMRSGTFRLKPAGDGTADRRRRDAAKAYIRELQAVSA